MKNISKKFLLLAAILIIFYLVLISVIFLNSKSDISVKNNNTLPTPTLVEIQNNQSKNPGQNNSVEYTPEEVAASKKERSIGELLSNLPHKGVNFDLSYEYETDSFNLTVNLSNQQQAEIELEAYLKTYGLTKLDLQNLFTKTN